LEELKLMFFPCVVCKLVATVMAMASLAMVGLAMNNGSFHSSWYVPHTLVHLW
jgi:hypothetical protein